MRVALGRARCSPWWCCSVPSLLLLPWWPVVLSDPTVLLLEPGVPLDRRQRAAVAGGLLRPGRLVVRPVVVRGRAAVAVLWPRCCALSRSAPVRVALVVIALALAWALVLEAVTVHAGRRERPVAALVAARPCSWRSPPALVTAAVAARGSQERGCRTAAFTLAAAGCSRVVTALAAASVRWCGASPGSATGRS